MAQARSSRANNSTNIVARVVDRNGNVRSGDAMNHLLNVAKNSLSLGGLDEFLGPTPKVPNLNPDDSAVPKLVFKRTPRGSRVEGSAVVS